VRLAKLPSVDTEPGERRAIGVGAAATIVAGSVLLSRLLGLLRETLLAAFLGVTAEGDLYRYAFVLPDLLNYLLAGGFLSITLIPLLARRVAAGEDEQARVDFTAVFRWVGIAIVALTTLLLTFTEPALRLAFPTLEVPAIAELTRLTRIVLPAQIAFVLGSLFMAYQYVARRFLIPALAPLVYNLAIIGGGILTSGRTAGRVDGFMWGAVIGAYAGTLGLQAVGAHRAGLRLVRGPSRAVPAYFALAFPLMIGQSVAVLDEQFPRLFGQLADAGAASALSFARMLNMLPIGIIAQAAAVASFPFMARLVAAGNEVESDRLTDRAVRSAAVASLAATAVVIGAARPLVEIVYEWGRFGPNDSDAVAGLLLWFALAIPAWGIHQVLARWFYAHERMWLPVTIGTAASVVAIPLTLWLFATEGVPGIAIASTVVIWLYTLAMATVWAWGVSARWRPLASLIVRGAIPTAAAAWATRVIVDQIPESGLPVLALGTLIAIVIGLAVFTVGGRPFRLVEAKPAWWQNKG